jgi:hypothetical protein
VQRTGVLHNGAGGVGIDPKSECRMHWAGGVDRATTVDRHQEVRFVHESSSICTTSHH